MMIMTLVFTLFILTLMTIMIVTFSLMTNIMIISRHSTPPTTSSKVQKSFPLSFQNLFNFFRIFYNISKICQNSTQNFPYFLQILSNISCNFFLLFSNFFQRFQAPTEGRLVGGALELYSLVGLLDDKVSHQVQLRVV